MAKPTTTATRRSGVADADPFMSAREVGALLGFHVNWVRLKAASGELPATRVAGQWRFRRSKVEAYLAARSNEAAS